MAHNTLPSQRVDTRLKVARDYGDVARIRLLSEDVYVISHAEGIKDILQMIAQHYRLRVQSKQPVEPRMVLTLEPKDTIPILLEKRL